MWTKEKEIKLKKQPIFPPNISENLPDFLPTNSGSVFIIFCVIVPGEFTFPLYKRHLLILGLKLNKETCNIVLVWLPFYP